MEKKALQLASVASMIDQFNMSNIKILQNLGYKVDVIADFTNPGTITEERCDDLKQRLSEMNVRIYDVHIPRSLDFCAIISAIKQVKKILVEENYTLMHCHSPIGGVIAREAAKGLHKRGLKVIYTAHGFHFYKGAPLKNWLFFYPIERHYSRYTDILITINKEDYERAKKHFKAKKVVYIPGVGVDTDKFKPRISGRKRIRKELRVDDNQNLLLSVGELNTNKNHESVIRAIKGFDITYVIVGKGDLGRKLKEIAKDCGVDVRMVGYRDDIADFYDAADFFILPSHREGLNVSLMEAMASSLPCLVGDIRGNVDLVDKEGGFLFNPENVVEIKNAVENALKLTQEQRLAKGKHNLNIIRSFDLQKVKELINEMYAYGGGYEHLANLLEWQKKRMEIGVPLNAILMLSVGELSIRKNHRVVVKALQKLNSAYWYVIVGKGTLRDELEALDHTGRLKLLGYRTDIVDLLHCCDLFVFPSLQEGLPVSLMEAMAAGANIVCSHIRGNTDLVEKHFVTSFNPYKWKQEIEKAKEDNNGFENMNRIKKFSIDEIKKCMKELYEGLLDLDNLT